MIYKTSREIEDIIYQIIGYVSVMEKKYSGLKKMTKKLEELMDVNCTLNDSEDKK